MCVSWDMNLDPISLQFAPFEHTTLLQLIDTDNKVLNKILVVFATLCAEVRCLQSEAKYKYYDTILFYGEGGAICYRRRELARWYCPAAGEPHAASPATAVLFCSTL